MKAKPFIKDTLFFLNITGMSPKNQSTFAKVRANLTLVLCSIVSLFIVLDVLLNWDGVNSLLGGSEVLVALLELLLKIIFFLIHRQKINKSLDDIEQFSSIDSLSEELQTEIKAIYKFVGKFRLGMCIFYWCTNLAFFTKLFFTNPKTFPIKIYQPFDLLVSPYYEIVYFLQFFNSICMVTFMLSFDFLFITYVTHAICELRILKHEFANLNVNLDVKGDEESCLKGLSRLVERHNFVLRFIKELNNMYSLLMLSEFIASTFCICLGLFNLSGQGMPPSLTIAAKHVLFLLSYTAELFIYCIGGNFIIVESASIADSAYESGWWMKTQPKLRKAIVLVMLRAQKAEKLTVGGMINLNLECFSTVVRTAFSFFTFMQAMQTEDEEILLAN